MERTLHRRADRAQGGGGHHRPVCRKGSPPAISRDLARSRAISRNLGRSRCETAYVWIAERADFITELSTLPGIVPRRYGGRTRRPTLHSCPTVEPVRDQIVENSHSHPTISKFDAPYPEKFFSKRSRILAIQKWCRVSWSKNHAR